ncbi:MAG: glycosyl hydrolase-related protein [Acidobacteriota bacterium]
MRFIVAVIKSVYHPLWRAPLVALVAIAGGGLSAAPAAEPGAPVPAKRIYIGMDDHTDYMWSADEAYYRQAFLEMIDFYLGQIDRTAKRQTNEQCRWNCDGSLWMWTYEKNKSRADFERFIERVRSGHMSVPLTTVVSCYGGMPAEAVLRSMYYAGSVERRYNIRFPLAVAMENQTLPYGLGTLFAGAGAKYSWHGICGCATPLQGLKNYFSEREHPLYWWTGPDGSRILMKWYPMLANNYSMGGYSEARHPSESVRQAESNAFTSRHPYGIVGLFGLGWDDPKTFNTDFIALARDLSTKERQVIVSNEVDFFEDVEKTYGDRLPSQSCAFGNDWDLHSATLAEDTARVKRAVEKLRTAEALATLVSLQQPDFPVGSAETREQTWLNLGLYYEHNWIANGTVTTAERIAWQRRVADQIETFVDQLHANASQALGKLIRGEGNHPRFFVFNPLGWQRTEFADLPLAEDRPVHVIDLDTNKETPCQVVTSSGARHLRILAANIPSIGYKVFEVRPGKGATFPPAASASVREGVLENERYRVTVAGRGAITSLVDKQSGRELVQPVDGRAVNDLGPGDGTLEIENSGPVSVTLRAVSPAPLKHTSRITLYRDSQRIDINNEIQENFGTPQTWSFAFKIDQPDVWHEEVGAVIRAKLLGDGGHYSPRNSRLDWLTLNHYVDVSSRGAGPGVTLSNTDCSFMRLGQSTLKELDASSSALSVLAGGDVSGIKLRILNQGGATYFRQRFALQPHSAFEPAQAMRFSLEHQNPLVAGRVAGGGKAYPEKSYSLLEVSRPDVFVWSVKPSEEGIERGMMVRVWNMAHEPVQGELICAQPIAGAKQTTHIETDLEEVGLVNGRLPVALTPQQIKTFRLMLPKP